MCGFVVYTGQDEQIKEKIKKQFNDLKHRGPDNSNIVELDNGALMAFHRLMIMDLSDSGNQPFSTTSVSLVCNGEIYNHKELKNQFSDHYKFESNSDCETIIPLYLEEGIEKCAKQLDAEFAFVLYDHREGKFKAARDPIGIRPMFYSKTKDGYVFSSEAKSLVDLGFEVKPFEPGTYFDGQELKQFRSIWNETSHGDKLDNVLRL